MKIFIASLLIAASLSGAANAQTFVKCKLMSSNTIIIVARSSCPAGIYFVGYA